MLFSKIRQKLVDICKQQKKRKLWREMNMHNFTTIKNVWTFPLEKVLVGKKNYGNLFVETFGSANEYLEIGSYCSIAQDVKFILGGVHPMNTVSTYPFKAHIFGEEVVALSKGAIIVKDDVWISTGVIILSGCTIGEGAVIAAGSVVTKSVEPYTIVGGNPAKPIRKRYSDDVIAYLMQIDKVKLIDEMIKVGKVELLYRELSLPFLKELEAEFLD